MSKELEALQDIRFDCSMSASVNIDYKNFNDNCDIVEKALKNNDRLLNIIKLKLFSIVYFVDEIRAAIHNINYGDYKYWYTTRRYNKDEEMYTEEEFNLVMEYLYEKRT